MHVYSSISKQSHIPTKPGHCPTSSPWLWFSHAIGNFIIFNSVFFTIHKFVTHKRSFRPGASFHYLVYMLFRHFTFLKIFIHSS